MEGEADGKRNGIIFFFQAEDGIRDLTVTGVQTCALPILFDDPVFWAAARQAAVWTATSIVLQTVLGVAVALLLNEAVRGINVFRGLLLFPYMVPTVVIALVWRWMFNPELGIVNAILKSAGIVSGDVYWLSDPGWAMASTILLNVWKFTPFVVICVLARLQSIPPEL